MPLEEPGDYEEIITAWNDNDVSAYRDIIEAKEDVELIGGNILVELDVLTAEALVQRARERGIDPARMASDILRIALVDTG